MVIKKVYRGATPFVKGYKGNILLFGGSRLPEGYQELEYIQSSGTQYINTLLLPKPTTKIDIKFRPMVEPSAWNCMWGSRSTSNWKDGKNAFCGGFIKNNGYKIISVNWADIDTYGDYVYPNPNMEYTDGVDIVVTNNISTPDVFYKDGSILEDIETTFLDTATYTMYLFANNNLGRTGAIYLRRATARLYYCKFYEGSTLVRDFVPCREISTSKVGLYDLVGGAFYQNIGTGTFIPGGEV